MIRKFHRLRRLAGSALLFILVATPFLRIGGESAFRFDIPSLRLLFFGADIWLADFFIVLVAVMFLTFATLFLTTLLGRIWCGWLCPQTVLTDLTDFTEKAHNRGLVARIGASAAGAVVSAAVAGSLIGYFVSPYELPSLLRSGDASAKIVSGSWAALSVILFLDIVALRRRFCATVCPYAKMQSVLFDDRTLLVAFDGGRASECMQCSACVKSCPVGIDIRQGTQLACIHCAECVDACTGRMSARNRKSLITYAFGRTGERRSGLRMNPLVTGVLTALSLVFLLYLSAMRMPFDMNVRLNYAAGPIVLSDGSVANSYELSLRNTGKSDLNLGLDGKASAGEVRVVPDVVLLPRGAGILRVPVSVTLANIQSRSGAPELVTLTARSGKDGKSLAKKIYFLLPKKQR